MPTLTHVHTYVKYWPNKWKNKDLFKCNDPHCTHYEERSMIDGKAALCNGCGSEFVLDREALRRVKPKCLACSDTKRGKEARAVKDLIASLNIEDTLMAEPMPSEFDDPQGGL